MTTTPEPVSPALEDVAVLRQAADHAPLALPAPLGEAAARWLSAEADCHASVDEVGQAGVDLLDTLAGDPSETSSFRVVVSTLPSAVAFARQVLALPVVVAPGVEPLAAYVESWLNAYTNDDLPALVSDIAPKLAASLDEDVLAGLRADLDQARAEQASMVRDLLQTVYPGDPMPDRPLDTVWEHLLDQVRQQETRYHALAASAVQDREEVKALRSGARTIPDDAAERVAEALREVRLNLGPNTLEAIYGGANHLVLSGAERHAIALTAIEALGLSNLTTDPDDEWEHRHEPAEDIGCTNPPAVSCSDAGCPLHGHDTEEGDTDE